MKYHIYSFIFLLITVQSFAQIIGTVTGNIRDKNTQEPLVGATVFTQGTTNGTNTDINGNFKLSIPVGTYSIKATSVGYQPVVKENIIVTSGNYQIINFELNEASDTLQEINVTYNKNTPAVATDMVTPLSVQQLTTEEIKSNPGGNYDVSKVIQTLPGVGGSNGGSSGPRNDIIIRGGAPNENVYYLDGVEIPVLNHFQTQGSSGGSTGILNTSFIDEVKLSSSSFDARYDNALASTFVIKQREGNPDKLSGNFRISGTEIAATLEGPLSKKTNFLISARKSYLQYLFQLLDLPIRPSFYDFQYKVTHHFNEKTTLTALGVGAIDNFNFAATKKSTPEDVYILRSVPYIKQWNYTVGLTLKRLIKNGFINVIVSRNVFNNQISKYQDEKQIASQLTYQVKSQEEENKFKFDINKYINGWKISGGVMMQYVSYSANLFNQISIPVYDSSGNILFPAANIAFNSKINFFKYGVFGTVSKNIFHEKLLVTLGLRTDMNSFMVNGNNPLNTLSPRFSTAYHVNSKFDITGSVGVYYKIPPYTSLGYRDSTNALVNQSMKYIRSNHYVVGVQYLPKTSLRFTLEGFYKTYSDYPVSVTNGISLANQGADYAANGNEKISSTGKGACYGFEFFVQQKLEKRLFYVFSYTFVRSMFSGTNNKLIPSSWDNQHLISTTIGYKFNKNWQLGLKYRFAGGAPYTPFNLALSQQNYLLVGTGTLDYSKINSVRLAPYNQIDIRVDKKINLKRISFDFFIDIQNLFAFKQQSVPSYTFKRTSDNTQFLTTNGQAIQMNGSNAIPVIVQNKNALVTPTIGIILEF